MEPQSPVPNSGAESGFSSPNQIVQVHSPLTGKTMPKKFDLNQPRPVLHKYMPEQVEVIYHRRSGDEVVCRPTKVPSEPVKTTPRRNSKKKSSNSAPNSASADVPSQIITGSSNGYSVAIPPIPSLDLTISQTELLDNTSEKLESSCRELNVDVAETVGVVEQTQKHISSNCSEIENGSTEDVSNSQNIKNNAECANSFLLDKVNELTQLIDKFSTEMTEMQSKLKKLESDNQQMARNNEILLKQYMDHIRRNSSVALEMKRLKNLVNKSESSISDQEVNALLTRARVNRTGKENGTCPMKIPTNTINKPASLSNFNFDIKEIKGVTSS